MGKQKDIDTRKLPLREMIHTSTGRWLISAGLFLGLPIFGAMFKDIGWFGLLILPLFCSAILVSYKYSVD